MKGRSVSIPIAMLTRKFYCHICGERLEKHPRKRTVQRGDPDYWEHSMIGTTHIIADEIELTEYVFKCPSCGGIFPFYEQCVIENLQKSFGRHILSQAEIGDHIQKANEERYRQNRIKGIVYKALFIAILAFLVCMCLIN